MSEQTDATEDRPDDRDVAEAREAREDREELGGQDADEPQPSANAFPGSED